MTVNPHAITDTPSLIRETARKVICNVNGDADRRVTEVGLLGAYIGQLEADLREERGEHRATAKLLTAEREEVEELEDQLRELRDATGHERLHRAVIQCGDLIEGGDGTPYPHGNPGPFGRDDHDGRSAAQEFFAFQDRWNLFGTDPYKTICAGLPPVPGAPGALVDVPTMDGVLTVEPLDPAARVMDADGDLWARLQTGEWACVLEGFGSPVWEKLVEDAGPLTLWERTTRTQRSEAKYPKLAELRAIVEGGFDRRGEDQNETLTGTASFVRHAKNNGRGDRRVYKLDPPVTAFGYDDEAPAHFDHVLVSAADVPFSGPETYIFGCDADGEVLDWAELHGSFRGGLDHEVALAGAGYKVAPATPE